MSAEPHHVKYTCSALKNFSKRDGIYPLSIQKFIGKEGIGGKSIEVMRWGQLLQFITKPNQWGRGLAGA